MVLGRGGSAGDRGKQGGEKREERAEVEIELCEKGGKGERQTDSSFVFSFALSLRLIRFPPVITSTNAG